MSAECRECGADLVGGEKLECPECPLRERITELEDELEAQLLLVERYSKIEEELEAEIERLREGHEADMLQLFSVHEANRKLETRLAKNVELNGEERGWIEYLLLEVSGPMRGRADTLIAKLKAKLERLREEQNEAGDMLVTQGLELERLREERDCMCQVIGDLESRLAKSVEPGSNEALQCADALLKLGADRLNVELRDTIIAKLKGNDDLHVPQSADDGINKVWGALEDDDE